MGSTIKSEGDQSDSLELRPLFLAWVITLVSAPFLAFTFSFVTFGILAASMYSAEIMGAIIPQAAAIVAAWMGVIFGALMSTGLAPILASRRKATHWMVAIIPTAVYSILLIALTPDAFHALLPRVLLLVQGVVGW